MKFIQIILLVFFTIPLFAQRDVSWKQHEKLAEELYMKSLYADAAEHYESAFRKKTKKKYLIAKAAECYYIVRDYKKAASAFEHIKEDHKKFPLSGLKYARSLKQSGKYDQASREFVYFINKYKGDDKSTLEEIVQNEIAGCEIGIKQKANGVNESVDIKRLSDFINTPETEFAPIPFNEKVLYYSSTMANKARIYFTMRDEDGIWRKAEKPKNFPEMPDLHYCNGSLSPDGQRFYFTICDAKESWGGLTTRCDIHVIKKTGNKWSEPEKLHDYINQPNTTATHPFVVHEGNKEIIYFSSNRSGGAGGMDLWSVERDLNSPDIDFTFPRNLGGTINTLGDEITPFYDLEEGSLYFSSNGQPTVGGQDIFKTTGNGITWETPQNIGAPFNSYSDDYYFVKTPNSNSGYIVSNRVFGADKILTTDEDLFEFKNANQLFTSLSSNGEEPNFGDAPVETSAIASDINSTIDVDRPTLPTPGEQIISSASAEMPVTETTITTTTMVSEATETYAPEEKETVEEIIESVATSTETATDQWEAISEEVTTNQFEEPTETVSTEVEITESVTSTEDWENVIEDIASDKFEEASETISSETPTMSTANSDDGWSSITRHSSEEVRTTAEAVNVNVSPITESTTTTAETSYSTTTYETVSTSSGSGYNGSMYTAKGRSKFDRSEYNASSPRHQGTYFKVQMRADKSFDANHSRYNDVRYLGKVESEFLLEKGLYRALLGDYFSLGEAKEVLRIVKQNGFGRAFVVKYSDGERYGMVFR